MRQLTPSNMSLEGNFSRDDILKKVVLKSSITIPEELYVEREEKTELPNSSISEIFSKEYLDETVRIEDLLFQLRKELSDAEKQEINALQQQQQVIKLGKEIEELRINEVNATSEELEVIHQKLWIKESEKDNLETELEMRLIFIKNNPHKILELQEKINKRMAGYDSFQESKNKSELN